MIKLNNSRNRLCQAEQTIKLIEKLSLFLPRVVVLPCLHATICPLHWYYNASPVTCR